jgi:4-hydroxymandelate oxidase
MSDALVERLHPRDYEVVARMLLSDPVIGWVTSGLGGDSDNEAAFRRRRLLPRALAGIQKSDATATLLGTPISTPIGVAPIGIMRALHEDGEIAVATGAASAGSVMVVGVNATTSIEDLASAVPDANLWLQLYNWSDRTALAAVVERAEAAGCKAIVPLVNTPLPVAHVPWQAGFGLPAGAELAHGAAGQGLEAGLGWDWLGWLASITSLPVVAKGIMHPDDAVRALDAGASAVWVSNHGGRQVPRSIATLDALVAVADRVSDRAEVYVDGGARSGTDVLIALASGARAVFVARPVCWGLAVGGAEGVHRVLDTLGSELIEEATMCGVASCVDVPREVVLSTP